MDKKLKFAALAFAAAVMISNAGICAGTTAIITNPAAKGKVTESATVNNYETVNSLDLVANPKAYLNKNINMLSQFDKFSTIGLDYPPVNKSSKDFISFIIKRPDTENKGYTIPFSEIKFIINREKAEKLIDLESGDKIKITGKVFSAALGDPWVDVDQVIVLESKAKNSKKDKK